MSEKAPYLALENRQRDVSRNPQRQILMGGRSYAPSKGSGSWSAGATSPSNSRDDYMRLDNLRHRVWYPAVEKSKLARRDLYTTQHTFATHSLASGEDRGWVAKMLGHTTLQIIFTTYYRYLPNLMRRDGTCLAKAQTRGQSQVLQLRRFLVGTASKTQSGESSGIANARACRGAFDRLRWAALPLPHQTGLAPWRLRSLEAPT